MEAPDDGVEIDSKNLGEFAVTERVSHPSSTLLSAKAFSGFEIHNWTLVVCALELTNRSIDTIIIDVDPDVQAASWGYLGSRHGRTLATLQNIVLTLPN